MTSRSIIFTAMLLAVTATSSFAQGLTETAIWEVASPKFFDTPPNPNSGTYYHPAMIQQGGNAFMFTQGGQFQASDSPTPWCEGDKIILWKAPLTDAGVRGHFTQIGRVSRCDTTPTVRYHWGPSGAFLAAASGPVYLIADRSGVNKTTGQASGLVSLFFYEGAFDATASDIPAWTVKKLFDVSAAVGGVGCCTLAPDTTRTAPVDGYTHQLFRGFGGYNHSAIEARFDFSQRYCDDHTTSAVEKCVIIEFKNGGSWRKVNAGLLDFVPDVLVTSFRAYNLFRRGSNLELWGSQIVAAPSCPCVSANHTGAQIDWYTVSPTDFSLSGPFHLASSVRCMPAEPAANRIGADLLVIQGKTYLFSAQNDDASCAPQPFVGMDVVTTLLQ